MATRRAPLIQGKRPGNMIWHIAFLNLSLVALYFMRISTAMNDVPLNFQPTVEGGVFPNGVVLKRSFTGIAALDFVGQFLVVAFIAATTGWNECFRLQSAHFLMSFTGILLVFSVESCRTRNRGKLITFTSIAAILYQGVGAAIILPLLYTFYHYTSSENSYFASGRAVPLPYARALLLNLAIYVGLTIAMYYPTHSIEMKQNLTALWQLAPILANIPLWIASIFVSHTSDPKKGAKPEKRDLHYLKNLYLITFLVCVFGHVAGLFAIFTSSDPSVSFANVFIPSQLTWKNSLDSGLLYIFQLDWVIIAFASLIMSWIAVWDVQRLTTGNVTGVRLVQNAVLLVVITVVGGPGATFVGVWGWRENSLDLIETQLKAKK